LKSEFSFLKKKYLFLVWTISPWWLCSVTAVANLSTSSGLSAACLLDKPGSGGCKTVSVLHSQQRSDAHECCPGSEVQRTASQQV